MAHKSVARRLERLISSWHRHGIRHVVEVFRQERIRRTYARSPIPPATSEELIQALSSIAPASGTKSESGGITLLLNRCSDLFPLIEDFANNPDEVRSVLLAFSSKEEIERDGRMISSGRFPALGLCICEPSGQFNWHKDYGSGKVWPQEPFNQIRYLDGDGADVKYVWELSRMYWIAWLGKAYLISEDEKWVEEFRRLIDDWRKENPPNVGVNWTVAMEVGIRAFWLAAGGAFFSSSKTLSPSWWNEYFASLWSHGTFIAHNLEYFPNLTNHYIANCFGLLLIGAIFRDTDQGDRWYEDGKNRLETELERQTEADGVNYERSIGYHGLVLEMYLIALIAAERIKRPFNKKAVEVIQKMAEFTADYSPHNGGTIPQLGDSDDGVILRLRSDQNLYDHRRLLGLAGEIFHRDDFRSSAGRELEETLLFFGKDSIRDKSNGRTTIIRSRLYPAGGFAAIRNHHLFAFADIGPIGLHGNNDTLSFTLHSADGTAWLVDPGTGCYTRDESLRNELRSTAAHNAPCIDETEIAEFAGLWRVAQDRTNVRILESTLGNVERDDHEPQSLTAEHRAYDRLPGGGVTVRRCWELIGPELSVQDRITGEGSHRVAHRVAVGFTIAPELIVRRIDATTVELSGPSTSKNSLRLLFKCSAPLTIRDSFYSPSYGLLLPAVRIEIIRNGPAPVEIDYLYRLVW